MIKKSTLFILGAVASKPYGYPTGKELRRYICKDFSRNLDYDEVYSGYNVAKTITFESTINTFTNAFSNSSIHSIDKFITLNQDFSEVAKIAIIKKIMSDEQNSRFNEDMNDEKEDWYSYFYNEMISEVIKNEEIDKIKENNISFITFNYDRSLEFFIYNSLINSFRTLNDRKNKVIELYRQFPVYHVYGKINDFPWESNNGLDYRSMSDGPYERFIDNIRIIYDKRREEDLEKIKALFDKYNRIFFMGFGFAKENLDILSIPEVIKPTHEIFCSAYGLTEKEILRIKVRFKRHKKLFFVQGSNLNLLKTCL